MSHKHRQKPQKQIGLSWGSLKAEWKAWYDNKSPVFQFGLKFAVLMVIFYSVLLLKVGDQLLYTYLEANAQLATLILNGLGQSCHVSEVTISSPKFVMAIRRGCDAVEPTWLFCAAVLAFPVPIHRKLIGMLAGIVLLQALNLVRIISLYFIGVHFPTFFNSAHLEIWPTVFIIAAIVLWVGWMQWSKRYDEAA